MKIKFKSNPIVVVGSIALDSVKTSFGSVQDILGGSATYFTIAARLFNPVQVVGVVGEDFPDKYIRILKNEKTDLRGLTKVHGKTFRWTGSYENPNEAITHDTQLNVFADFNPVLPDAYRQSKIIFLANIHPMLQQSVLLQVSSSAIIASDTMNHWIKSHPEDLIRLYKKVNIVFLNEGEAKLLTGENLLVKAAKKISKLGPKWVVIKKGEHGVLAYDGNEFIIYPAYPVEKVVDTTGAGDSFAGAFMGVIAKEGNLKRATIQKALMQGTIVSSFTIEDFSVRSLMRVSTSRMLERYKGFIRMIAYTK